MERWEPPVSGPLLLVMNPLYWKQNAFQDFQNFQLHEKQNELYIQHNLQGPGLCASTYSGTFTGHRPQSTQNRQKFDKKSPVWYAWIQSNENPRWEHKVPAVCWMTPVLDINFGCQFAKCWMSSVSECWGEKPQGMPEIVLSKWNGTANISNKIKTTLTDLLKYVKLWRTCKVSVQLKFHIMMAWRLNKRSRHRQWTTFSAS
jgi:hypothetical protein